MAWCMDCGYCGHGPCVDDCGQKGGHVCMGPKARRERAQNHSRCTPERCNHAIYNRFCPSAPEAKTEGA